MGTEAHLAVLTDGSKGSWDPAVKREQLVEIRHSEQAAAANTLGAKAVHHLDYEDGELQNGKVERAALVALIRRIRPDVILGHDPWKRYRLHPDHRAAGNLAIEAVVAGRDPHFFPDQGPPHRPTNLLLFEAEQRDHFEPIEEEHFTTKLKALLCHKSQWHSTMGIEEGSQEEQDQLAAFAETQRREAEAAGLASATGLAEAFKRIRDL
jgi:LmbE family N-acetylglucosaminyl deacetylase